MKRSVFDLNSNELGWLYAEICYGFGSCNLSDYENDLGVDKNEAECYAQYYLAYIEENRYEDTKENFVDFIESL